MQLGGSIAHIVSVLTARSHLTDTFKSLTVKHTIEDSGLIPVPGTITYSVEPARTVHQWSRGREGAWYRCWWVLHRSSLALCLHPSFPCTTEAGHEGAWYTSLTNTWNNNLLCGTSTHRAPVKQGAWYRCWWVLHCSSLALCLHTSFRCTVVVSYQLNKSGVMRKWVVCSCLTKSADGNVCFNLVTAQCKQMSVGL